MRLQPLSSCLTAKTLWTPPNWFTRRRWTEYGVCVCEEQLGPASSYTSSSSPSSSPGLDSRLICCLHTAIQASNSCFFICLQHVSPAYSSSQGLHLISHIPHTVSLVLGCQIYRGSVMPVKSTVSVLTLFTASTTIVIFIHLHYCSFSYLFTILISIVLHYTSYS